MAIAMVMAMVMVMLSIPITRIHFPKLIPLSQEQADYTMTGVWPIVFLLSASFSLHIKHGRGSA